MSYEGLSSTQITEFQEKLLDWYAINRRSLPWRDVADPYAVLVSEIMLQQTGVERVRPIFERFMSAFPTFEALANAARVDVLRAWAGLGYNRRAVNLHECAMIVARDYGGVLPRDPAVLRRLPGIGPYTEAAIRSFVFREDIAAIDTNVRRVVGRVVLGVDAAEKRTLEVAAQLVPEGVSASWNQALMDLGATCCTAWSPDCERCPLDDICLSAPTYRQSRPTRKIAERREPFQDSRRYRRGRVVAFLREQPSGSVVPLVEIARVMGTEPLAESLALAGEIARSLAADGLARIVTDEDSVFVGPPL